MKNTIPSFNSSRTCLIFAFFIAISILISSINTGANATSPHYTMTFSITNFNSHLLLADADDLSDPMNSLFRVKNGTHLWYAITVKSQPTGISITPANQSDDLITSTFFGAHALLPPAQILPFDEQDNANPYEILKLRASFSGSDQRLQLILSPFDPHAITLDILNLLLNVLGQHTPTASIGLLAPGTLAEILTLAPTMKDFQALTKRYTGALQNATKKDRVQAYAQQCAVSLVALLDNTQEQSILTEILWKMQGKAISQKNILSTITQFSTLLFSQPLTASISNTIFAFSSTLLQQNMPSILLQTTSMATPTPRPAPTPMPTPTPMPLPTPTPTTPRPAPTAVPLPTPATRITSTINTTCTAKTLPATKVSCTKTNTICTAITIASTTHVTCTTKVTPAPKATPAAIHHHKKTGSRIGTRLERVSNSLTGSRGRSIRIDKSRTRSNRIPTLSNVQNKK